MVSLLVVQIIKYRLGVPVVAMESRIRVQSRNPVKYVKSVFPTVRGPGRDPRRDCQEPRTGRDGLSAGRRALQGETF